MHFVFQVNWFVWPNLEAVTSQMVRSSLNGKVTIPARNFSASITVTVKRDEVLLFFSESFYGCFRFVAQNVVSVSIKTKHFKKQKS